MNAAVHRILPVNIDSVKNSRRMDAGSKITFDEGVDTGAHEIAHVAGIGCARKALRLAPASKRDQHAKVRMKPLQLKQLMKRPAQLVWTFGVGLLAYALSSRVTAIERRFVVHDFAAVVGNASEGVIDL